MEEYVATHLGNLYSVERGQKDKFDLNRTQDTSLNIYSGGEKKEPKFFPKGLLAKYYEGEDVPKFIQNVSESFSGNVTAKNSKKMFVFGAGASHKCVSNIKKNNGFPLTKDLLEDSDLIKLLKQNPLGKNLLIQNRNKDFNLEKQLQQIVENLEKVKFLKSTVRDISVLNILLGNYFKSKSEAITTRNSINLYDELVSLLKNYNDFKVNDENYVLINFNYDLLLDKAIISTIGKNYQQISNYISTDFTPFRYYKPHGSCNWGLEIKTGTVVGTASSFGLWERVFDNDVTPFDILAHNVSHYNSVIFDKGSFYGNKKFGNSSSLSYNLNSVKIMNVLPTDETNMFYPVIHLPFAIKDTFLMPPLLRYTMYQDCLNVEELYIIGFKMNEIYFENYLKEVFEKNKKLRLVWIVDPKPLPIYIKLKELISNEKVKFEVCDTFEEFVREKLPAILEK